MSKPLKRLVALMVVAGALFAGVSLKGYLDFRAYKAGVRATWTGDSPWDDKTYSVDACHAWAWEWQSACEGLPTLCKLHSQSLFHGCLKSRDRTEVCEAADPVRVNKRIYQNCTKLVPATSMTMAKAKGTTRCNAFSRVMNDVCRPYRRAAALRQYEAEPATPVPE